MYRTAVFAKRPILGSINRSETEQIHGPVGGLRNGSVDLPTNADGKTLQIKKAGDLKMRLKAVARSR